ncbi:hypothetical protein [Catenuloplanes atrovinosus]|uniref:Uncharacterized protein n=1 Tax=Catenuloplanes atrovinosus TaxID=137266 RepID=A0AAE4C927_9ACTN|nr:hypothetical protein [Catenuloplanes atrovinosus]MDR7276131.1 hypothetical protein [Catenuloplanes atrovinosus]
MTQESPLVADRYPRLAAELAAALRAAGEHRLADRVPALRIVRECGCGDDFCRSLYSGPPPDGPYGPGHRCVWLVPPWAGLLNLDVVDDVIRYVEIIDRPALD